MKNKILEDKEYNSWNEDDKREAWDNYFDLVHLIHNNMDLIPKMVQDKIWDKVYMHFEP